MKNALRKDFIREIKKNKGRFLSIFFIVMLGTAFFSGVRSAGGDMKYTADEFYKRSKMMDIRVVGTYGITEDDLTDMRKINGVDSVTGGYSKEVLVTEEDEQYVLKLIALTEGVNEVILTSGRLPERPDECIMDSAMTEYRIGDVIIAESGTEDPLGDDLTAAQFTIVGFGNLPYYLDLTRGVGSIGNGSVKAFAMIPSQAFCMDLYTESYIRVAGADEFNSYSDEYQELVDRVSDEIEGIENKINTRRYETIVSDAQKEIDDAKKELEDAQKELDDAKEELDDGKKELDDAKEELNDAKKELEDGKKELDDAKKELEDGKKELDDAKKELEDGEKELTDAKAELDDAKAELEKGEKELAEAKTELDSGEKQLADSKTQLDDAKKELDVNGEKLKSAKKEIDEGEKQLNSAKEQLDEAKKTLEDGKKELDARKAELDAAHKEMDKNGEALKQGWAEYNAGKTALEEQSAALEEGKTQLEQLKIQLAMINAALQEDPENAELIQQAAILETAVTMAETQIAEGEKAIAEGQQKLDYAYEELSKNQAAYDEGAAQLAAADKLFEQGESDYEAGLAEYEKNYKLYEKSLADFEKGKKEYEEGNAKYQEGVKQYEAGLAKYQQGLADFQNGKKQYENGVAEYENGKKQYEEGLAKYQDALTEFEDGKKQYEDGLKEYEDGKKEYEDGLKEYEDGKKEYEDGLKEYEDALAEYEDGLKEYEDACAEHIPEIEDGWKEVHDAEDDLRRLEKPKLYALDRDMIQSVSSLNQDSERMDSLGNVFPVIFFLVAALVSLTAMTRMVDEQRQEIGTLKALGFSSASITWKYLEYAMIPSLIGGFIGIFIGEYVIPKVIIDSYRIMYTSLDKTLLPFNWQQGIIAVGTATACTSIAAWAACYRKLKEKPASLMRPEAPASGRRVFLEYVTPIWNRLNFTAKATVRNLFRYKKRFFMTIIGIGACMGLIIVGFGLYDSITDVAKRQYREIFMQEATVGIDSGASVKDIRSLKETVNNMEDITDSLETAEISATLYKGKTTRSATIYVPDETENITNFLRFQDRRTHAPYEYPLEGVGLSEKAASMLGVKVGDTILVQKGESGEKKEAKVTVIVENYVLHYCFMTKETYKGLFGEYPDYNSLLIRYEDTSPENEKRLGGILVAQKACTSVNFTTDFQKQIDDMLSVLTKVIWVLLISAGLLAFVVLYNLNNINITERKRELATLKVLGFRDYEVALYVYRENIFLTIFGIVVGCFIGIILHQFTIQTVEVDLMMFGRAVRTDSFIRSALITVLFAVIVNTAMYFSLKKIDMIESLKSVE